FLPGDTAGILRAFVHSGDEMFYHDRGIHDGDVLLAKKLEVIPKKIKLESVPAVVTPKGIITRRLLSVDEKAILLKTDNSAYENRIVSSEEMLEIWQAVGVWSQHVSPPSLLESRLMTVESQLSQMNNRLLKLEK